MDIQKMIGEQTDRQCACGGTIYENLNGDWWCDSCSNASDEEMSEFLRLLYSHQQVNNNKQGD